VNPVRLSALLTIALSFMAHAADSSIPTGQFLPLRQVASTNLAAARTVRIWLPPGYEASGSNRFPVLYLHDGQNVFSSAGPGVAFGWGPWNIDKTAEKLIAEGRMRPTIMVAVDNSPKRFDEYAGPRTNSAARAPFDAYSRFLIDELKPAIDREFRTLPGPKDTAVLGSSMGGLCSVVLAWERPDVFGGAAGLSSSFWVEKRHFLENVLGTYSGPKKPVRFYLDSGVKAGRSDDGRKDTADVAERLKALRYVDGVDLKTFVDDHFFTEAEMAALGYAPDKQKEAGRAQHNEFYWRQRVWRALEFLLPRER
jgi:predicted alpha/beta superfamily hydrolase